MAEILSSIGSTAGDTNRARLLEIVDSSHFDTSALDKTAKQMRDCRVEAKWHI